MGTQHFGKPLTVPVVSIEEKEMIRMFATHFTDPIEKSAVYSHQVRLLARVHSSIDNISLVTNCV